MGNWQQVGENLVRHVSGNIYLRARVAGKIVMLTLKTKDLRIAKLARDEKLDGLRKAAALEHQTGVVKTIGDAINVVSKRELARPDLEAPTVGYYKEMFAILRETLPVARPVRSWTPTEAGEWWKSIAKKYASQRANNVLGMAKRVGKVMLELGVRIDDPFVRLKRVRIVAKNLQIPTRAVIDGLIADIRGQKKAHSEEAANYVAFLAFSGCRSSQAKAFEWKHVEEDWILFPAGIEGTKGAAARRLPISPPLRELLGRMRKPKSKGPLFQMKRPHESLKNACVRLKIPHLRIHDLRHFFASYALSCGVDVLTASKWLGHKDGGALILKTYGHLQDEHSLASALKLGSAPVTEAPEAP